MAVRIATENRGRAGLVRFCFHSLHRNRSFWETWFGAVTPHAELDAVKAGIAQILLFGALLLVVSGCGEVQGQSYAPMPMSASKTVIYIYRPWHFLGSGNSPMVTCGHDSIELDAGGYHTFYDEPGQIMCSAAAPGNPQLKFTAESNVPYYVREEYGTNGQIQFTLVDSDVAKSEIASCKLQSVAQAPATQ